MAYFSSSVAGAASRFCTAFRPLVSSCLSWSGSTGACATHLGRGITQNSDAGLIHYVTDGKLRPRQGTRGVGDPGPVELHIDLSDIVALYCVQQAPDDPPSVVSSSMTIYNEIVRQHPEWLPCLERGFIWDRAGEEVPGESEVSDYLVPAFSEAEGIVSCRFHAKWIRKGLARVDAALSDEEEMIFDFIRDVSNANSFAFSLHEGDIAICNNYTVCHGPRFARADRRRGAQAHPDADLDGDRWPATVRRRSSRAVWRDSPRQAPVGRRPICWRATTTGRDSAGPTAHR